MAIEIGVLLRGRGLRSPALAQRVGPALRAALHMEATSTETEVRDRVIAALRAASESLPADLRAAFQLAAGFTSDRPLLSDRVSQAGDLLDRDVRTIRRRLIQAQSGIADVLARGSRPQPHQEEAWYIETMDSVLDLRGEGAVVRAEKVIVPTQGDLVRIVERFSLPDAPADLASAMHPSITVLDGGTLAEVTRRGSVWHYEVDLNSPLAAGLPQRIVTEFRLASTSLLRPILCMVPIRPCRRFSVRIHFGHPPIANGVWRVDGEYPTMLSDEPEAGAALMLPPDGTVDADFSGLRAGLAYGLRWAWSSRDGIPLD